MPNLAQALKWFPVVTLPEVRFDWRTDQNWVKVLVPSIEGALTR
jgi:hypothetical protein